jgi:hypothetical protein
MKDDPSDVEMAVAMVSNALISNTGSRKQAAAKAARRAEDAPDNDHHAFWKKVHTVLKSNEPIAPHRGHFPSIPNPHAVHYERVKTRARDD